MALRRRGEPDIDVALGESAWEGGQKPEFVCRYCGYDAFLQHVEVPGYLSGAVWADQDLTDDRENDRPEFETDGDKYVEWSDASNDNIECVKCHKQAFAADRLVVRREDYKPVETAALEGSRGSRNA